MHIERHSVRRVRFDPDWKLLAVEREDTLRYLRKEVNSWIRKRGENTKMG